MAESSNDIPERKRTKSTVALTLRLPHAEWERLHKLALSEGLSIQSVMVQSLNLFFKDKGQRPLKIETFQRIKHTED